jgi:hypothetical protein
MEVRYDIHSETAHHSKENYTSQKLASSDRSVPGIQLEIESERRSDGASQGSGATAPVIDKFN